MTEGSKEMKQLIYANVSALVIAVITIVWNWAVMTTKVGHIEEDIRSLRTTQNTLVILTENLSARVFDLSLLREDVERLESFHFSPQRSPDSPTPSPSFSPAVRWPPRESHPLDSLLPFP